MGLLPLSMSVLEHRPTTPHSAQKIGVVESSLVGLLDKLLPEVEHGRVSSLVVDDTSGRSVGIFLHRALELLGHKLPLIFVCPPGPHAGGQRDIAELSPRQIDQLGDSPVVVTEVIHSGEATGSIVRALNRADRIPMIASLSGFLIRDDSEPWSMLLLTSREGRHPPGLFSKVIMPEALSFEAQDLLSSDKLTSGVLREDAASTRVLPTAALYPRADVRREVRAFRSELYNLADSVALARREQRGASDHEPTSPAVEEGTFEEN